MYKEGAWNLVPILYIFIPIALGLGTGIILKKLALSKVIYSIIISIVTSIFYLSIISFYTSSKNEIQLLTILFIWNSILIFIFNKIYLYFYKKRKV